MLFLPVVTVCLAAHVAKAELPVTDPAEKIQGVTHKDRISYDYRN